MPKLIQEKNSLGFTLVELLLVSAILVALTATAIFTFPSALSRGRDQRRRNDIRAFQAALETYAQGHGLYFPSYPSGVDTSTICTLTAASSCPTDPLTGARFLYFSNGSGGGNPNATQYVVSGVLEEKVPGTATPYAFVACSSGKSGKVNSANSFPNGVCPATLLP